MCHFVICLQPAWVLLLNLTLFPPAISSDVSYHRDYHTCAYLCGTVPWHPKPLTSGSPWIASEAASLNLIIPLHPLLHCCPNGEAAPVRVHAYASTSYDSSRSSCSFSQTDAWEPMPCVGRRGPEPALFSAEPALQPFFESQHMRHTYN